MAILVQSNKKPSVSFPSLTGDIITFNSQYAGLPLKSHTVALTATQSGSGTPSPDNVRPITGYSELHITNSSIVNSAYSTSGTVAQVSYATVTILSANSFRMVKSSSGEYPATRQPLSGLSLTNGHIYKLYAYFNISSQTTKSLRLGLRNGNTFTSEVVRPNEILGTATQGWVDLQFEYTSSKSTYDIALVNICDSSALTDAIDVTLSGLMLFDITDGAISIQNATIQIGSTIYGGEYDARTGVLTVTHGITDLDTLSYSSFDSSGGVYRYYARLSDLKYAPTRTIRFTCSCFKDILPSDSEFTDNSVYNYNNDNRIIIATSEATDTTELQALIQGQKLVYELATPQTIQLPPCPINTLQGENNIWADTGTTTAQYIKIGG